MQGFRVLGLEGVGSRGFTFAALGLEGVGFRGFRVQISYGSGTVITMGLRGLGVPCMVTVLSHNGLKAEGWQAKAEYGWPV